mmetsp:Transcript_36647/g.96603  ORF Transcript_36647/g.96603 Transcript_36647/m.96603 type:complete len:835 (+) Transcript_36647:2364-4868(+)
MGLDMCSALKSLHHLGVIHRDVKPSNIMRVEGSLVFKTESSESPNVTHGTLRSQAGQLAESNEAITASREGLAATTADNNFESNGRRGVFKFAEEKVDAAFAFGNPMSVVASAVRSTGYRNKRPSAASGRAEIAYKLIDLGTAVAVADAEEEEEHSSFMTVTQLEFAGTPAYSSPESFIDPKLVNFYSDVWSLAATIFHLVAGRLPFEVSSVSAAASLIGDMTKPTPDIRDCVSEEKRSTISQAFAQVLAKGLEKDPRKRYQTVDDMATDLYGCLVSRGEGVYTAFISYRVASEKFHAQLLYQLLNNTVTPAGNRVIVYLDVKRLVKGEDWEQGFALGLLNSLVAVPLVSKGLLEPLVELHGTEDDRQDNLLKELVIMQMLMESVGEGHSSTLRSVFPILVGAPHPEGHPSYPYTGNLFVQGSPAIVKHLSRLPSPPTASAVADFLERRGLPGAAEARSRGVSQIVQELFSVQAAQLWNHGTDLPVEDMAGEESLEAELQKEPPEPPLDGAQFRAIKAELRALIPSIHEVIDRAYVSLAANPPGQFTAPLPSTASHLRTASRDVSPMSSMRGPARSTSHDVAPAPSAGFGHARTGSHDFTAAPSAARHHREGSKDLSSRSLPDAPVVEPPLHVGLLSSATLRSFRAEEAGAVSRLSLLEFSKAAEAVVIPRRRTSAPHEPADTPTSPSPASSASYLFTPSTAAPEAVAEATEGGHKNGSGQGENPVSVATRGPEPQILPVTLSLPPHRSTSFTSSSRRLSAVNPPASGIKSTPIKPPLPSKGSFSLPTVVAASSSTRLPSRSKLQLQDPSSPTVQEQLQPDSRGSGDIQVGAGF